MGTKERKMVEAAGIRVSELIALLNKAYADEWLAYYQYWVGAKIAVGIPRESVVEELSQHAEEELKHAEMLAERIIQLGGVPILEPRKWYDVTNCGYSAPKDPSVRALLDQNIKGEQCAIGVYRNLLKYTKDKDPVTYDLLLKILTDEVEHEEDLENLKEDIEQHLSEVQKQLSPVPAKKSSR